MSMSRKAFIRVNRLSEVLFFKNKTGIEEKNLTIELLDVYNRSKYLEEKNTSEKLEGFMSDLNSSDHVIVQIKESEFSFEELCDLIEVCKEKSVKLEVLNDKGVLRDLFKKVPKNTTVADTILLLKGLIPYMKPDIQAKDRKGVRKSKGYPDNFLEVYNDFKCNNISYSEAINMLDISQGTFYTMIKRFES